MSETEAAPVVSGQHFDFSQNSFPPTIQIPEVKYFFLLNDDDDVENFSEHSYAIKNQLVASKAPY